MEDAELTRWLAENYAQVRQLPDGTYAGLNRLLYTTAIFLDLDAWGWGRRFCFESDATARERFAGLQSADDEPAGYVAKRGR